MKDVIIDVSDSVILGAFEDPVKTGITFAISDRDHQDNNTKFILHSRDEVFALARILLTVAQRASMPEERVSNKPVSEPAGLDTRLDEIETLPQRIRWRLTNILNLVTIRDLVEKTTVSRLLRLDNMGKTSIAAICDAIEPYGGTLKDK